MSKVPPPPTFAPGAPNPSVSPPQSETGLATLPEDVNPGPFEELHRKTKEIFPQPFEGARLIIQKGLSSHFQVSHTLVMSNLQPSGYKFGSTYVGNQQYGQNEAYPILLGEVDLSGGFSGHVVHQFTKAIKCKFVSQVQDYKWVASQMSADYKGKDYVASVTMGNVNPVTDSGVFVLQYLQTLSRRVAAGAELIYQRDASLPGKQVAILSLGSRYTGDNWQVSGSLTPLAGALKLCYYHKATENLQIGVELDGNMQSKECTTTVGYQIDLPKAESVFKGQIDTNLCISATMEKRLSPMPFLFTLSAYANHVKGMYRFGIGMIIG